MSFGAELAHILENNLRRPADRQLLAVVLGMPQLVSPPAPSPFDGKRLGQLIADITARKPPEESGLYR